MVNFSRGPVSRFDSRNWPRTSSSASNMNNPPPISSSASNTNKPSSTETELPWTTARCNRLLRPISSRLASLRKTKAEHKRLDDQRENSTKNKMAKMKELVKKNKGANRTDPDWIPLGQANGGGKRTYKGRSASTVVSAQPIGKISVHGRPGEISITTPFFSRIINKFRGSPTTASSLKPTLTAHEREEEEREKRERWRRDEQLNKEIQETSQELAEQVKGLEKSFSNLLQATQKPSEKSRKGTRSLMETCLRQVPRYIAYEEQCELEEEGDRDVEDDDLNHILNDEIYSDLECMGPCEGQGWRHLREVVRAHGVALLCDAIEDRSLEEGQFFGLYRLCMNAFAYDEAEALLDSLVSVHKQIPPPSRTELDTSFFPARTGHCLSTLEQFAELTGRYQFFYDQLRYMVSQHILPAEWLAALSFRRIWTGTVRVLSDASHHAYGSVVEFLETVVCIGSGLPLRVGNEIDMPNRQAALARSESRDALNNTFSSLFTLLSSIALASHVQAEQTDEGTVRSLTWGLEYLAVEMLRREDIKAEVDMVKPHVEAVGDLSRRGVWCLAASLLVQVGGCSPGNDMLTIPIEGRVLAFDHIIASYPSDSIDTTSVLEVLPTFISHTARCSGKAWKDDGFDQLQRLTEAMLSSAQTASSKTSLTLRRLVVDSALAFAEETKDPEHFSYARKLGKTLRKNKSDVRVHSPAQTPAKSSDTANNGQGFHWEEGIGEWVIATPFAHQPVTRVPRQPMRTLVVENDSGGEENSEQSRVITSSTTRRRSKRSLEEEPQPAPKRRRLWAVVIGKIYGRTPSDADSSPSSQASTCTDTDTSVSSQDTEMTDTESIASSPKTNRVKKDGKASSKEEILEDPLAIIAVLEPTTNPLSRVNAQPHAANRPVNKRAQNPKPKPLKRAREESESEESEDELAQTQGPAQKRTKATRESVSMRVRRRRARRAHVDSDDDELSYL